MTIREDRVLAKDCLQNSSHCQTLGKKCQASARSDITHAVLQDTKYMNNTNYGSIRKKLKDLYKFPLQVSACDSVRLI